MRALLFKILFTCSLLFSSLLSANSSSKCVISQDENIIKICQDLADKGDAKAQNTLGLIYLETADKIAGNHTKARLLFTKAAKQGLADAEYNLGAMYRDEFNNFPIALQWFEKAAAQNHAEAQNSIGYIYENGYKKECKPRDYNFDEQGQTHDQEQSYYDKFKDVILKYMNKNLPRIYPHTEFGCGIDQNYVEAAKWYQKAADQKLALAQTNLGYLYLQGLGVPKDEQKGFALVKQAAEQDFAPALNMLSFLYIQGIGTTKNPIKGIEMAIRSNHIYPVEWGPANTLFLLLKKYVEEDKFNYYYDQLKKMQPPERLELFYPDSNPSDEDRLFSIFGKLKSFYQLDYFKFTLLIHWHIFSTDRLTVTNITNQMGGEILVRELNLYKLKQAYQGQFSVIERLFGDYDAMFYVFELLPEDQSVFYMWFEREQNMGGTDDINRIKIRIDGRKKEME